jgi:hypothetical protein
VGVDVGADVDVLVPRQVVTRVAVLVDVDVVVPQQVVKYVVVLVVVLVPQQVTPQLLVLLVAVAVAVVVGPMGTLRSVSTFGLVYATLATAVS